jgi:hypothetical protein
LWDALAEVKWQGSIEASFGMRPALGRDADNFHNFHNLPRDGNLGMLRMFGG